MKARKTKSEKGGAQQHKQRSPTAAAADGWWQAAWPVLKTLLVLALFMLALLGPSRDWAWPAAWLCLLASGFLILLPCYLYIRAFNQDLLQERMRFTSNKGTASFEMLLVPAVVWLIPARLVAAGVQHWAQQQQPGWAPTPLLATPPLLAAAAVVVVLSCLLQTWSVCSNKYFSSVVRIQHDRGHKVCSHGPYAYVRHPGYVAFSLQSVAECVLLQSSWAAVAALAMIVLLAVRTVKENAFLLASLPGYAAYAQRVRYSWVPLVW